MKMLNHRKKVMHLRAEEFLDLSDGLPLEDERVRHAEDCSECRETLRAINELQQDVAEPEHVEATLARVDWIRLRSAVRDQLLSHAVERSTRLQRWTGWSLKPAAAWSLALVLLVSGLVGGGIWHHRTAHPSGETAEELFSSVNPEEDLFDESNAEQLTQSFDTVSADTLGWADVEIFTSLHELQAGEEEILRELISLAFTDDAFYEEAILQ